MKTVTLTRVVKREDVNEFKVDVHAKTDGSMCSLCGTEIPGKTIIVSGRINPDDAEGGYLYAEQKCLLKLARSKTI